MPSANAGLNDCHPFRMSEHSLGWMIAIQDDPSLHGGERQFAATPINNPEGIESSSPALPLNTLVSVQKVFAANGGLPTNGPQRRAFDPRMIRHGERSARAIGILSDHRNVFALLNHFKTQYAHRGQYFGLRSIHRKFHKLNGRLGDEGVQRGIFALQRFTAEGFNVKANSTLNIMQGFVKRIAFSDDDALNSNGVSNITIGMLFNNNFHSNNMPLREGGFKWIKLHPSSNVDAQTGKGAAESLAEE